MGLINGSVVISQQGITFDGHLIPAMNIGEHVTVQGNSVTITLHANAVTIHSWPTARIDIRNT